MRVFAISDLHTDYRENRGWLENLSRHEYKSDVIIVAGDIADDPLLIEEAFGILSERFEEVFFVPGNHDLWVRCRQKIDSLMKLREIKSIAGNCGVHMEPRDFGALSIVPLYSWYDYTFGEPNQDLINVWADFYACRWPEGYGVKEINSFLLSMNREFMDVKNEIIISFSHFLPSMELMPLMKNIYPVMGSLLLKEQVKNLGSTIHVYGHSHINMKVWIDGVLYVNNAYGYPHETLFASKELLCIYDFSVETPIMQNGIPNSKYRSLR